MTRRIMAVLLAGVLVTTLAPVAHAGPAPTAPTSALDLRVLSHVADSVLGGSPNGLASSRVSALTTVDSPADIGTCLTSALFGFILNPQNLLGILTSFLACLFLPSAA